jgi:hypothetical protein
MMDIRTAHLKTQQLADEIFRGQPELLVYILALPRLRTCHPHTPYQPGHADLAMEHHAGR